MIGRSAVVYVGVIAIIALASPIVPAGVALADPAGPTDCQSTVLAVTPPMQEITARTIGGDSFFELTVSPGVEVLVAGYQDEPYLRFRSDGVVEENRRSPTTYQNTSLLGGDVPGAPTRNYRPTGSRSAQAAATPGTTTHALDVGPAATGRAARRPHPDGHRAPAGRRDTGGRGRGHQLAAPPVVNAIDRTRVGRGCVAPVGVGRPSAVGVAVARCGGRRPRNSPGGSSTHCRRRPSRRWRGGCCRRSRWGAPCWPPCSGAGSSPTPSWCWRRWSWWCGSRLRRDAAVRAVIPTDAPFWLDRGVMAGVGVVALIAAVGAGIAMYRRPAGDVD